MEVICFMIIGGIVLYAIIVCAVKAGVKEALDEFKEDIVKEFDLKKVDANKIDIGKAYNEKNTEKKLLNFKNTY